MDKLVELLGKIFKAVFSAQVLWLLVVAVAVLSLGLLIIVPPAKPPPETPTPKETFTPTPTPAVPTTPTPTAWVPTSTPTPTSASEAGASGFFGVDDFVQEHRQYVGLAALASLALILTKGLLWILGRIREQFFT